jgi:hypothetical protein
MRALRVLLVSLVACGALVTLAPASGAAVPAASKACNSYKQLQKDLDKADPSDAKAFNASAFKKVGAAFKKAAKSSPAKVKAALNTLGDYYNAIGGKGNYVEALQEIGKNGQKFSKAIGTFSTYIATACT